MYLLFCFFTFIKFDDTIILIHSKDWSEKLQLFYFIDSMIFKEKKTL